MTAGRPTDYREEYCDKVIELAKIGYTHIQIAAEFEIAERTLYDWKNNNPKFLQALTRAKAISKANFMKKAYDNLENKDFNTNLLKLILSHNYKIDTSEIRKLKSTSVIDKINEIFEQYENGYISIEVAERASKLLGFQLDEESRKKLDYLYIQSKNSEK